MSAFKTLVVGTDGSESSMCAVDRAGAIAAENDAKLIIAMAHLSNAEKGGWSRPPRPDRVRDQDRPAEDALGVSGYRVHGDAPIYEILREARERAQAAGARNIEERPIVGDAIHALVDLAEEVRADLLVVGNVGLSSIAGRLLGSVPGNVSQRAKTDVLIVHTSG